MGAVRYLLLAFVVHVVQGAYLGEFDYEGDHAEDCTISEDIASPFVTALYKTVDSVVGCQSQQRNNDNREVHIINIINEPGTTTVQDVPTEVTLHLKPLRTTDMNYSGRLLFVLNSAHPVIWTIHSEHMSNITRHLFWISRESKLNKDSLPLNIKIKKQNLLHNRDGLMNWVLNEESAITSYTQVYSNVNTLIVKVGIDRTSPENCDVTSTSVVHNVQALSLKVQKTKACVAKGNQEQNNGDVHIIEVEAFSEPTNIVVEMTQRAKKPKVRRIILVLKSHHNVTWSVYSRGVKGDVIIITDDQVDTSNVQLKSVSVAAERLQGLDEERLIGWTRERYGPAVSYTKASRANKFILVVDGGDVDPFQQPARTKTAIITARNVHCGEHRMKVVLIKRILNTYGIHQRHLSLLDEACVAQDNSTHYILETGLNECGTKIQLLDQNKYVYTNAIVVSRIPENAHLDVSDFSGSGYVLGDTHMDDEDLVVDQSVDVIKSDFKCEYQIQNMDLNIKVSKPQLQLNLYIDDGFTEPLKLNDYSPLPVPVGAEIYVEAKITGASQFHVLVDHCMVMEPRSMDKHNLIRDRCNVDTTLVEMTSPNPQAYRFVFTVRDYFDPKDIDGNPTKYLVTCQLNYCSGTTTKFPDVIQCPPKLCNKKMVQLDFHRRFTVGPFKVSPRKPSKPTPNQDSSFNEDPCEQARTQETHGLDSATVVGIAFAAFVIGVLLVSALWVIHSKTASKSSPQRPRFVETSGESTPSSTAPITIHQVNHH